MNDPRAFSTSRTSPPWLALCFALLLPLLWVLYRVAFDAPFYFDTVDHLVTKTNLHLVDLSARSLSAAIRFDYGGKIYRPLSYLTLALTHYFWGLEPRAYRIGNLVIHWSACLALFFLFRAVLASPQLRRNVTVPPGASKVLPLVAVIVWGLHPIQTNVVTYEIQRMASLCGLFLFLAVACYVKARSTAEEWSWAWGVLFVLSSAAAVASKENGVVVVALVLIAEGLLLDRPATARAKRALLVLGSTLLLVVAVYGAWKASALVAYLENLAARRTFTVSERLLTQAALQPRYLLLLLVPDHRFLTLDADVAIAKGLLASPAAGASVVGIALALFLAVRVRMRHPLLSLAVIWFFGAQLIESTVLPLELYFEHRLYVPSAFVYLGAAVLGWEALRSRRNRQALGAALLLGFIALESWATVQRNRAWANPVLFWADAAAKEPLKPRPHINLGLALLQQGLYEEADRSLFRALALGGEKGTVHLNLAETAHKRGRRAEARAHLEAALEQDPDSEFKAHRSLAALCVEEGKLKEGMAHAAEVLKRRSTDARAWNLVGTIQLLAGDLEKARTALERSTALDPTFARAWNNLGVVHHRKGEYRRAEGCFAKAQHFDPSEAAHGENLERARRALGNSGGEKATSPSSGSARRE